MAFDAFMKVEGVKSESTRAGHEKEIELISFSWGASNPTSIGIGEGGGSGKVSVSTISPAISFSPRTMAAASLRGMMRWRPSMRAWAIEASNSSRQSRRSMSSERV